jgi:hypothetical protein
MIEESFFHSLSKESDKLKFGCKTIGDLIGAVHDSWEAYDSEKLKTQWAHMYSVWNMVLQHEGSNQFKNPHSGQRNAINRGLPTNRVMINESPMTAAQYDHLRQLVNDHYGRNVF